MYFAIGTGVLSGVMTWILIYAFSRIVRLIIIPWYQNKIYRGIDISGSWNNILEINGKVVGEQTLELIQTGHKISGDLVSNLRIRQPNINVHYNLEGEIADNYVYLRYIPSNKKHFGGGTVLLKITEGGEKMSGGLVAIDRFSSNVMVSQDSTWTRRPQ